MKYIILLISIWLSIYSKKIKKIAPIKYATIGSAYYIKLSFGSLRDKKFFELNLETHTTYFFNSPTLHSSTLRTHESGKCSMFDIDNISYTLVSDVFYLPDDTPIDSLYIYYFLCAPVVNAAVGFGANIIEENNSIIHYLYKNKFIQHLRFGINNTIYNDGYLYLGGFPDELINDKYNTTIKNKHMNQNKWGGYIGKAVVNGKKYISANMEGDPFYLSSGILQTLIPKEFFNFLYKEALDNYFKSGKCKFVNHTNNEHFECDCKIFETFPKFQLIIDNGVTMRFKKEFVYKKTNNHCRLLFEENKKDSSWRLGTNYLKNFGILFDYENNSFTLYDNKIFEIQKDYSNPKFLLIKTIFICIYIILLLGFIVSLFIVLIDK